jgi:hypothetical protein
VNDTLLVTDLRCALPANGWTDTGSRAHDLRPRVQPAGKWQILDYRSTLYAGSMLRTSHADACELYEQGATALCRWDAEPSLATIQLDDPEVQRLWATRYAPPADNLMLELGGLNLEAYAPGIGY